MNNEWSHLPNAARIDWVLASVKSHPEAWSAARSAARSAAWCAAGSAAWSAASGAAGSAASGAAWSAVSGAIAALIAWDNSAEYLDMTPTELEMWYLLSSHPACILLLPAVRARETIGKQERERELV